MQDFTLTTYKKLLQELLASGYSFHTFQDFIQKPKNKTVILRHDVDRKPKNTLVIAKIEKEAGIKASYYLRIVKESYDENIIRQIAEMGHEIGYHYENLSEVSKKNPQISQINADEGERGKREEEFGDKLFELAICDFERNLEKLRELYPVKTICMHGSPLSKWDNRDLWKRYNYRDFGIIAEPYFDIDFDEVFYLTDTGRRWNGDEVSVRDKIGEETVNRKEELGVRKKGTESAPVEPPSGCSSWINSTGRGSRKAELGIRRKTMNEKLGLRFRYTWDIIEAADKGLLPDKVMLNTHPQRWTDKPWPWVKELVWQNVKNLVKKYFFVKK